MITSEYINNQFKEKSPLGKTTTDRSISTHDKIYQIMLEGVAKGKIWWFAYEFAGKTHTAKYGDIFVSYEVSSRVAEMVKDGLIITERTEGKLNLYRLPDSILL